jgi:chlorophyllase
MRSRVTVGLFALVSLSVTALAACGGDASTSFPSSASGAGGGSSTTATTASGSGGASGSTTDAATGTGGASSTGASTSASSGTGAGGPGVSDPTVDGPYDYAELDGTVVGTSGNLAVHAAYPTGGPDAGPYPVVVVAHGFQLPPSQYYGYVRRLATFGYVALAPDYPASFFGVNNVENAEDLIATVDWAAADGTLGALSDTNNVGMTGHSMGGKLALLAASFDARVKASITLDPVDSSMNCSPTDCPDVSDLLPLGIPTGFIGELLDASGGFQPCAPAADNFTTFYAKASSPSLSVEALGANHMSFLDDVASCGLTCNFCNQATAPNAQVNGMSKALVVAFYERHLRGNAGYDTYLTGADAQTLWVTSGQATITSK